MNPHRTVPGGATAAMIELDVKKNRARQEATFLINWLRERGYIAPACAREAVYDLAEAFYKDGVEFTNREQREAAAAALSR